MPHKMIHLTRLYKGEIRTSAGGVHAQVSKGGEVVHECSGKKGKGLQDAIQWAKKNVNEDKPKKTKKPPQQDK